MGLDLDSVRLFVLAADMLNISAAGRQLGLAPAVASTRLARLENQIGADLLHRSTRKVSLSLEGAEFLPFAREILAQEEAARAALGNGRAEVTGTLRFACSSTFAQRFIAPILPEFLKRHPGVNLDLKLSDVQMDLIEGACDLALRNYAIEESSLRARKLADDKRILCASPDYLARFGTPETIKDLADHELLYFRSDARWNLIAKGENRADDEFPKEVRHRVTCDDGASMKIATMAGTGISVNSLWNVYTELNDGSLVHVLPTYRVQDPSAIWLVYPRSNVLTAKVRVFIDFILEKIGDPPIWERSAQIPE